MARSFRLLAGLLCLALVAPVSASAGTSVPTGGRQSVGDRRLIRHDTPTRRPAFRQQVAARRVLSRPASATGPVSAIAGTASLPIALVQFNDNPAEASLHTPQAFQDLLFQKDYPFGGSMRDYYLDQSGGLFDVTGQVTPSWLTMPRPYDDYSGSLNGLQTQEPNSRTLARDAAAASDPYMDFCENDYDGNGFVDTFFIVHAGAGAEESSTGAVGTGDGIWSHKTSLFPAYETDDTCANGKTMKIRTYTVQPEEHLTNSYTPSGAPSRMITIGVFAHEYGHALGLPDLYDIDYSSPGGVGTWDLMAAGANGFNGMKPSRPMPMSAWTKTELGWAIPKDVIGTQSNVAVASSDAPHFGPFPGVYRLYPNGIPGSEYFLVENRTPEGWAADIPRSGLLVWHVDESKKSTDNSDNSDDSRRLLHLLQADGNDRLGKPSATEYGYGDAGDLFPGSTNKTSINASTSPNTRLYSGADSRVTISNISVSGGVSTATLSVIGGEEIALPDPVPTAEPSPTASSSPLPTPTPTVAPTPSPTESDGAPDETEPPTIYVPGRVGVNLGRGSGSVTGLAADDDAGYNIASVWKRRRYRVDYDLTFATGLTSGASGDLSFEIGGSGSSINAYIYNHATGRFEYLQSTRLTASAPWTVDIGAVGPYVDDDGSIDLGFTGRSRKKFRHSLDYVRITRTPAG